MKSFRALIERWPTLADFARDIGVSDNSAKQMRTRNSIPPDYWGRLARAAERRGIEDVTLEVLVRLKAQRKRAVDKARPSGSARRAEAA